MKAANHNKLVLAVVREEDYDQTVQALGKEGIFVTRLSSTGGFLRRKNTTLMIGVEESRLPDVYRLLQRYAGKRRETQYTSAAPVSESQYRNYATSVSSVPLEVDVGGATVFTLSMDSMQKF